MDHALAVAIIGNGLETEDAIRIAWKRKRAITEKDKLAQCDEARDVLVKKLGNLCGGPVKTRTEVLCYKKPRLDPPRPQAQPEKTPKPILPQPRKPRAQPVPRLKEPPKPLAQPEPPKPQPVESLFDPAFNRNPRLDPQRHEKQPEKPRAAPVPLLPQPNARKPRAQPVPQAQPPKPLAQPEEPLTNYEPPNEETARLLQAAWYGPQQANVNYKPDFVIPPVFYDDQPMPQAQPEEPLTNYELARREPPNEQVAWYGPTYDSQQANGTKVVIPPVFYADLIDEQPLASACYIMPDHEQPEPTMSQDPETSDSSSESSPVKEKRPYKMGVNRTPRAADAKPHKKKDFKKLDKEMKRVFSRNFKEAPGAYIQFTELFIAFSAKRTAEGRSISEEEKAHFRLWSNRIFKAHWTSAHRRLIKEKWSYYNIAKKDD